MTEDEAWIEFMGQMEATVEDIQSARKIGRSSYDGNAVVLPKDDPLIQEWERWDSLYG